MGQLNWRRGMIRLWIVVSVLWIVGIGYVMRPDQSLTSYWALKDFKPPVQTETEQSAKPDCKLPDGTRDWDCFLFGGKVDNNDRRVIKEIIKRRDASVASLKSFGFWSLGPVLAFLILGFVLGWVARGFIRR